MLVLLFAPIFTRAQVTAPAGDIAGPQSGHFPAMYLKTHSILTQNATNPAWEMQPGGELTVANGSLEFKNPADPKNSFSSPIGNVRSVERRRGPEGFPVVRIKLQNGKNFDLVPDSTSQPSATGEKGKNSLQAMYANADAMEKAIRDMAAENKVVLK
jgi:hypothetical protein